eukprot:2668537-Alexandrium_andersonii.AAC.1
MYTHEDLPWRCGPRSDQGRCALGWLSLGIHCRRAALAALRACEFEMCCLPRGWSGDGCRQLWSVMGLHAVACRMLGLW